VLYWFSYAAGFNRSNRDAFSGFRIYRETLSRFSCAASLESYLRAELLNSALLRRRRTADGARLPA
ncbi:hypothetical protein ACB371_13870, partial [Klebsiella pneumoniae]